MKEGIIVLTTQEKQIINLLRNPKYRSFVLKRQGESSFLLHCESITNSSSLENIELLQMINDKEYGNIQLSKRDGKLVNIKINDVYKF